MQDKERAECYRMLPDSLDWSAGLRRKLGRNIYPSLAQDERG